MSRSKNIASVSLIGLTDIAGSCSACGKLGHSTGECASRKSWRNEAWEGRKDTEMKGQSRAFAGDCGNCGSSQHATQQCTHSFYNSGNNSKRPGKT